jgi:hypothetical protein
MERTHVRCDRKKKANGNSFPQFILGWRWKDQQESSRNENKVVPKKLAGGARTAKLSGMMEALKSKGCGTSGLNCLKFLFCGLVLMAAIEASPAAPAISTDSPVGFFTSAADRLLRAYTTRWATTFTNDVNGTPIPMLNPAFVATFNVTNAFGVTAIPVLVSNQFVYTPAVNRLLQLAANICDATTTNLYPDIFRPVFNVVLENGFTDVYICGYTNQTTLIDHSFQMAAGANNGVLDPPVEVTALPPGSNILANVYGVPWNIGAKKGFPNFNAFSVESAFQLVRKLEVERNTNNATQPDITWTNQMYLMNITNYMALSCWNSYSSNYPGPVDILVRCGSIVMLTNDNNMQPYGFATNFAFATEFSPWPGWGGVPMPKTQSASIVVPLNASVITLTNAIYYYGGAPGYKLLLAGESPSNYLDKGIQPLPHFWLMMTNRLQVAIIDYSTNVSSANASGPVVGRIVDYVQLGGMDSSQLLNSALGENDPNGFWNTNYDVQGNLLGVHNQIQMSQFGTVNGITPAGSGAWNDTQIPGGPNVASPAAQQAFFHGFFAANGGYFYGGVFYVNTVTAMQAPYTPMAYVVQHTTWAANDPLVHYLASDLAPINETSAIVDFDANRLRFTNDRYQPWGLFPPEYYAGIDSNPANLSYKDPLVRASDNWNFPTGQVSNLNWMGQVHRGTPWQTIYLKSTNILNWASSGGRNGNNTWRNWTGDFNAFDAINSAPVEDWYLVSLLSPLLTTNSPSTLVSVNNSDPNAWLVLLDGMTALTNNLPNIVVGSIFSTPQFAAITISSNSPQAAIIASAIETTRLNQPGQSFAGIGSILAIPQLTSQSPFLNWNNAAQQANGISDQAYEAIPSQLLPLLRADSVGSVLFANGETVVQFSGSDGHAYVIEVSPDLVNWTSISTNWPVGGVINFKIPPPLNPAAQFYRSVLLN